MTAASLVMFLILSLLHLGDVKQVVGGELERLEKSGVVSVEYKGQDPELAGRTFTLDEIKKPRPSGRMRSPARAPGSAEKSCPRPRRA